MNTNIIMENTSIVNEIKNKKAVRKASINY